jgi:hypothetical protein
VPRTAPHSFVLVEPPLRFRSKIVEPWFSNELSSLFVFLAVNERPLLARSEHPGLFGGLAAGVAVGQNSLHLFEHELVVWQNFSTLAKEPTIVTSEVDYRATFERAAMATVFFTFHTILKARYTIIEAFLVIRGESTALFLRGESTALFITVVTIFTSYHFTLLAFFHSRYKLPTTLPTT